jgi:CheY-like chemotaxis protein
VTDLNRLVAGMSELLRRTIGEHIIMETVLAGGLWPVNADAHEIERVLLNLAVNARDAMPDGGRLTIETNNTHLDDDYIAEHDDVVAGQYVMICVTDTGTGMTPNVLAKAFDPFFSTKGVGKGTGLGLSQLYGFAKQSAGHAKIYSEVGHGTSVKLYLPRWLGAERPAVPSPLVSTRSDSLPRGNAREVILVVEDEERVNMVAVEALRDLGYTVRHAANGEEALAVVATQPGLTLLFTDIVMPGMTGRELADRITDHHPEVKVLYTTGYTRNAVIHGGVIDPGVAFLPKPFTIDQLARKIRATIDGLGANR